MSYIRQAVMLLGALALTACGGGGGGGASSSGTSSTVATPAPAVAASAASTVEVAAPPADSASSVSVVACTPGDAAQTRSAAFALVNVTRVALGLPPLTRLAAFDTTAQAHARYAVANSSTTADETQGQPCYTGANLAQRLADAGVVEAQLPGRRSRSEILFGYTASTGAEPQAWDYVTDTMSALYGRLFLLDPRLQQVGVGFASQSGGQLSAMVLDTALLQGAVATSSETWAVWPRDGATGLATRMRAYNLRPLDVVTEGYPITLHAATAVQVSRFVLSTAADGATVPASLVTSTNDRNGFLAEGEAALLPHAALAAGTTYRVELDGSVGATPLHLIWSFTTAP